MPFRPSPWIWVAMLGVGVVATAIVVIALARDGDEQAVETVAAVEVPTLVGLTEDEAVARLREAGLDSEVAHELGTEPAGEVVGQAPEPGAALERGATVVVRVAAEHEATTTVVEEEGETVVIPDVVGGDHVEAGAQIEGAGLVADSLPVDTDHPAGTVVALEPAPATAVAAGSQVRMSVSIGARQPAAPVPEVVGFPADEARAALREAGFTVRTMEHETADVAPGTVVGQEPAGETAVPQFRRVTLHVAG